MTLIPSRGWMARSAWAGQPERVCPQPGMLGPLGTNITPTQVFTVTPVDLNGNGLYDQLTVDTQVQVSQAGQ